MTEQTFEELVNRYTNDGTASSAIAEAAVAVRMRMHAAHRVSVEVFGRDEHAVTLYHLIAEAERAASGGGA